MAQFVSEKSIVLEVIFYDSTKDFGELKYSESLAKIICPSPSVADGLRRHIDNDFEIITISKWVTDALKSKGLERINKAQLMLKLASVWRHYFPNGSSFQFFHSFELFTELRSFTLDLNLLSEFLGELDEVTAKSIFIFWSYLDNEKLIDEHLSYSSCSDVYFSNPIWLIGFKNMSGIQIDMLKKLAENQQVAVFIPRSVYQGSIASDWTKWIIPGTEVFNLKNKINVSHATFPQNKLNISLGALRKIIPEMDIVVGTSEVKSSQIFEIANSEDSFKTSEDFLKVSRQEVFKSLREIIGPQKIANGDFNQHLQDLKNQSLLKEDYLRYKVVLLTEDCLGIYQDFQPEIDDFSLRVFQHVVELNSPRVYAISHALREQGKIMQVDEIGFIKHQKPTVLIASASYGSLRSSEKKLNETLLRSIKFISPIKRAGLEFLFLKNDILNFLSSPDSFLLVEEGLELSDLSWREILSEVNLNKIELEPTFKLKDQKDFLAPKISSVKVTVEKISASKLQSFIDCPRKYYFSYIDKIDHRPQQRMTIGADEMGIIEHKVIKKYFDSLGENISRPVELDVVESICDTEIDRFLISSQISLSQKKRKQHYYEILNCARNGIEFLSRFILSENAREIKFEVALEKNHLNLEGFIDCVVYLPDNRVALFDFKRSSASVGTKAETLSFKKIQIWIYVIALTKFTNKQINTWGYINLSEVDESLVFNENQKAILTPSLLDESLQFISNKINELKNEENFLPTPRNTKICHFCEVSLFCPRGVCK